MLDVGPGSLTPLPIEASCVVSTAKTVFELESNVAAMLRVGDTAIRPGEPPGVREDIRGRVSLSPLMMTNPPKAAVAVTP